MGRACLLRGPGDVSGRGHAGCSLIERLWRAPARKGCRLEGRVGKHPPDLPLYTRPVCLPPVALWALPGHDGIHVGEQVCDFLRHGRWGCRRSPARRSPVSAEPAPGDWSPSSPRGALCAFSKAHGAALPSARLVDTLSTFALVHWSNTDFLFFENTSSRQNPASPLSGHARIVCNIDLVYQ